MRMTPRAVVVIFAVPPVSSFGPPSSSPVVSAIAVIPARFASSRLPGKALAEIGGKPMIEHVYRRTALARSIESVIVVTDDERIYRCVQAFGGTARMTSPSHQSGTDRIAEIASDVSASLIVNVQGDEPLIEPAMIDEAVAPFASDSTLMMSTLRRRIDDDTERQNPNVTKVVVDQDDFALYFSRAPIPFVRSGSDAAPAWRHVGLYVYRRECLMRLAALPPTQMEKSEALEQLRALEHGIRIKVVETRFDSIGVDTAEDLARVRATIEGESARARAGVGLD